MSAVERVAEIERLEKEVKTADPGRLADLTPGVRRSPRAPAGGDAGLFPSVTHYLRVGPIPLPAGASAELTSRAASFIDRWLSGATVDAFTRSCDEYTADVRVKRSQAESLRTEVQRLRDRRQALDRYLELLDALEPGAGHPTSRKSG